MCKLQNWIIMYTFKQYKSPVRQMFQQFDSNSPQQFRLEDNRESAAVQAKMVSCVKNGIGKDTVAEMQKCIQRNVMNSPSYVQNVDNAKLEFQQLDRAVYAVNFLHANLSKVSFLPRVERFFVDFQKFIRTGKLGCLPADWGYCIEEIVNNHAEKNGWTLQKNIGASIPDFYKEVNSLEVYADLTSDNVANKEDHVGDKLDNAGVPHHSVTAANIIYPSVSLDRMIDILLRPRMPAQMPMMLPQVAMIATQPIRKRNCNWSSAEDKRLLDAITLHGESNWAAVAVCVEGRTKVECSHRWNRTLNPQISREAWTEEENERLRLLVEQHGTKWQTIALEMGNRSDVQCRYHYNQISKA